MDNYVTKDANLVPVTFKTKDVGSGIQLSQVLLSDANGVPYDANYKLVVDGSSVTQPISAVALPLPAGASTSAGQAAFLTAVNLTNTKLDSSLGNQSSILTSINLTNTKQDSAIVALGLLHTDLNGTIAVSQTSQPLPTGAATDAKLSAILAAIQAQTDLETSIWTDGTLCYVRREIVNEGTGQIAVSYVNPDGTSSSVNPNTLHPVASDSALTLLTAYFDVTIAGTGTSVGDVLGRIVVVNKGVTPPTATSAIWLNFTTGLTLTAAPNATSVVEQTAHTTIAALPLPPGAATDASVQAITASLGTDGASPPSLVGTGVRGWLRSIQALLGKGQNTSANSLSVVMASDGALGQVGDVAVSNPAANGTLIALAKGILSALQTTLRVTTPTPNNIITGQVRITTTGTAVQLPSNAIANNVMIKAKTTNTAQSSTYSGAIGSSNVNTLFDGTGNGYAIAPGEVASIAVSNTNAIWVNGTAGDVFTYRAN